jgi:hypothetical protein
MSAIVWVPIMLVWAAIPWRVFPDDAPVTTSKRDEVTFPRQTLNGNGKHGPELVRVRLGDELTLRVMDIGRASFIRCFKRAMDADPTVLDFKVKLRVELDVVGNVTTATTDAQVTTLSNCLVRTAYGLPFPAPGTPAVAEIPLLYRGEL